MNIQRTFIKSIFQNLIGNVNKTFLEPIFVRLLDLLLKQTLKPKHSCFLFKLNIALFYCGDTNTVADQQVLHITAVLYLVFSQLERRLDQSAAGTKMSRFIIIGDYV